MQSNAASIEPLGAARGPPIAFIVWRLGCFGDAALPACSAALARSSALIS